MRTKTIAELRAEILAKDILYEVEQATKKDMSQMLKDLFTAITVRVIKKSTWLDEGNKTNKGSSSTGV